MVVTLTPVQRRRLFGPKEGLSSKILRHQGLNKRAGVRGTGLLRGKRSLTEVTRRSKNRFSHLVVYPR